VGEAVNPLYIRILNPEPYALQAELTVTQKIGSPWRGWAERILTLSLLLPPERTTAYVLPWPLRSGERYLHLSLWGEAGLLAETDLPLPTPAQGLVGYTGPPPSRASPFPAIPFTPTQLPRDPLFLSSFRALHLGEEPLAPELQGAARTWEAFFGPEGLLRHIERKSLAKALGEIPLSPRPLGLVAAGTLVYLGLLYVTVGRLAREGDWRPYLALFLVATGASIAATRFIRGERVVEVRWEIEDSRAPGYVLQFAALAAKEEVTWELPGLWVEMLPTEEGGWSGRNLTWRFSSGEKRTSLSVAPDEKRILWTASTYTGTAKRWERYAVLPEGIRTPDGRIVDRTSLRRQLDRGMRPVVDALLAQLAPGDSFWLEHRREEGKNFVRHRFEVFLERAEG